MKTYTVYLRSVPGFYAQYLGSLYINADSEDEAVDKAFDHLRKGAFPDRDKSMWKVEKIEILRS